ncbi:hypothetical protein SAMN02745163_02231 [Clostridium cavendishii DSM 21758]|uniref:Uncharacterized protein n=1 Tax=Clostridium cavendishii DSM 21758 TaxID=1121302 RepID=A0A1M6KLI1_9CLOT|nr:hypothetical protein [Clostridium cavendishii]SHJ59813.1 hypothetical protein SAMN02745163_02231 [Clostridium cavendishii DSM 21758]
MKELREQIDSIYNYFKNNDEQDTELNKMFLKVIEGITDKLEEIQVNLENLDENISYLNEDLSDIQEDIFEEVTLEELEAYEDEYIEVTCNNCNKAAFIEKSALENNKLIPCPFCNNNLK